MDRSIACPIQTSVDYHAESLGPPPQTVAVSVDQRRSVHRRVTSGGELRPGTVHELDKDRSGLLVIAKSDLAMANLLGKTKARTMLKGSVASVPGDPTTGRAPGRMTGGMMVWAPIDALIVRHPHHRQKMAVVERLGRYSLVRAWLETDRTHQIRVQLASVGHSGAGDPTYTSGSSRLDSVCISGK